MSLTPLDATWSTSWDDGGLLPFQCKRLLKRVKPLIPTPRDIFDSKYTPSRRKFCFEILHSVPFISMSSLTKAYCCSLFDYLRTCFNTSDRQQEFELLCLALWIGVKYWGPSSVPTTITDIIVVFTEAIRKVQLREARKYCASLEETCSSPELPALLVKYKATLWNGEIDPRNILVFERHLIPAVNYPLTFETSLSCAQIILEGFYNSPKRDYPKNYKFNTYQPLMNKLWFVCKSYVHLTFDAKFVSFSPVLLAAGLIVLARLALKFTSPWCGALLDSCSVSKQEAIDMSSELYNSHRRSALHSTALSSPSQITDVYLESSAKIQSVSSCKKSFGSTIELLDPTLLSTPPSEPLRDIDSPKLATTTISIPLHDSISDRILVPLDIPKQPKYQSDQLCANILGAKSQPPISNQSSGKKFRKSNHTIENECDEVSEILSKTSLNSPKIPKSSILRRSSLGNSSYLKSFIQSSQKAMRKKRDRSGNFAEEPLKPQFHNHRPFRFEDFD